VRSPTKEELDTIGRILAAFCNRAKKLENSKYAMYLGDNSQYYPHIIAIVDSIRIKDLDRGYVVG
jgi:hypothetical protein